MKVHPIIVIMISFFLLITACSMDSSGSAKEITAFIINDPPASGVIDQDNHTILVKLPYGSDNTSLIASFTTTGAEVAVDGVQQVSGSTVNDFSNTLTYTVVAEDGSSLDYVVTAAGDPYNLSLGDRGPAGGHIFYINPDCESDGWKYLEAAADDESNFYIWIQGGDTQETRNGFTNTGIGTGLTNSNAITKQPEHSDSAAALCLDATREYKGTEYKDWYLPSKDELNLMFVNLKQEGLGGYTSSSYWSSSEADSSKAWSQSFNLGIPDDSDKDSNCYVRPVRSF